MTVGNMTVNPAFDISRIIDHPDKLLLSRINEYFIAFATGDYNQMDAMVAEEYQMSDVCQCSFSFLVDSILIRHFLHSSWYCQITSKDMVRAEQGVQHSDDRCQSCCRNS